MVRLREGWIFIIPNIWGYFLVYIYFINIILLIFTQEISGYDFSLLKTNLILKRIIKSVCGRQD